MKIPGIIVEFSDDNPPLRDCEIDHKIKSLKDGEVFKVSNELVISALRVFHKENIIKINSILFNKEVLKVDNNGNLDLYPPGFCEASLGYLIKLV